MTNMPLEELNFKIYQNYHSTIYRYLELIPCNDKEKMDSITLNIRYAIIDINNQIKQYNPKKPELSIYYQLMIKTDFFLKSIETLCQMFDVYSIKESDINHLRKKIWGDDFNITENFRLYRNLTLAHPLDTIRPKLNGFDDNNNKWCEDVKPRGFPYMYKPSEADYVITIREKGKDYTTSIPITINNDILPAALAALRHLKIFTDEIFSRLSTIIEKLENEPIEAKKDMNPQKYIAALKRDLKKRYPDEIEIIEYIDGTTIEYCILNRALSMLYYTFSNPIKEEKYKTYKEDIKNSLYEYGDSVQHMDLYESGAYEKLSSILCPNPFILIRNSKDNDAKYKHEKIWAYLKESDGRHIESAKKNLDKYTYDVCVSMEAIKNTEFGVICLLSIKEELDPYFPINLDATDKELFLQYCTAVYFANKSSEVKE